jgi:serine phosphatase RsbU (regulator of sigma subunit)
MKKWITGFLTVATILFFYVFVAYRLIDIPFLADQVKEWTIAVGLAILLLRLTSRPRFERMNLVRKLYAFGVWVLAVSTASAVLPLSDSLHFEDKKAAQAAGAMFLHIVLAIGFVIVLVILFLLLKELIFVQQTRRTAKQFRLLLIAIFLNVGFVLLAGPEKKIRMPGPFTFDSPNVFFILLILVSILLGFRVKWIPFLNKRSKLILFFAGSVVFGFFLSQSSSLSEFLNPISASAGTAVSGIVISVSIYFGMALAGLLIHLPTAGLMDRKMREVKSFQELSAVLGADLNKGALLGKIPALATQMVDADIAWLELMEGGRFETAAVHRRPGSTSDIPPDSMCEPCRQDVTERRKTVLMNDLSKCKRDHSKTGLTGSLLAAPVISQSKILGILFAMKAVPFGFVEESQGLFQAFANQAAISLENVQLVEQSIKQEKAEEELRLAHQAQMRLLPQTMPKIRGFEVDGLCVTANEIGGDFYDVISARKDRIDIVIGDVSGKGATAAFYMAEFKGVIQALVSHFASPKEILIEMNAFLRKECDSDTFLTMVYAILQPSRKKIRLARAGHCPVGLIRGGKVTWMETKGLGLGLSPEKVFRQRLEEVEITLRPDDILFFYTDGLTEARNPVGEEFGEDRLTGLLSDLHGRVPGDLIHFITSRVEAFTEGFPRHDDITLLALHSVPSKKAKKG